MLSKYYYNQLNSTGKTVYDALIMGLGRRQKEIRVPELPNEKVMAAIRMENPQLYFVDFSVWNVTEFMGIHKIAPTYMYDERQCDTINAKADALYRRFAPLEGEHYLRKVHNFFVRMVSYDETEKGKIPLFENHSLVGPVINGRGVCEGISFAYAFLLKRQGFDCTVVTGMCEGEGHMWNVVCLNGNNYHIDVTNDITQTGSCFDKPCYFYSWIIEFQLRLIFATCDEGKNIKDTLDMAGVEYLRHIADKNKGNRGESTRCRVLTLAEELQGYIDAGTLTFDVFADWIKRYSKLSEDMPVIVEFELFNGLDGAIELLREHEHDQYEDRENLDLLERFQIDCTC